LNSPVFRPEAEQHNRITEMGRAVLTRAAFVYIGMDTQPNLTSPAVIAALLREHGLRPKKRLGQNFLVDRNVLNKILTAAELTSKSSVLEIGPGLGTVTRELALRAKKVVAVEADKSLMPVLNQLLSGMENAEMVEADFLRLQLDDFLEDRFPDKRCTVVANLPYYITTPIITQLIECKSRIALIVLMVQKEVARRLIAAPGSDDYGSISVFIQYHCEAEIVANVSRNVFFPPPEVDSALVRLRIRTTPPVRPKDEEVFFKVVRAAFGQRRKTILNALSGAESLYLTKDRALEVLQTAGIAPDLRGETLSIAEFAAISDSLGKCPSSK
jgi:16S rRNA (adenine1518-N6/adenine1519-N6)-dimethyltransferase